ncbi:MAG: ABC transporter substrate-binding protein [Deltaproteobacteria bacterium]|nr:ABC transporter substrate-binding protein [Deltaproteobacteria bacterium]
MPEPEFGGLYAAAHYGYDREEGLALDLVSGGPGVPSAQLVASGKVDFGVLGADQVVAMRAQGADLVGLYASFQVDPRAIVAHAAGAPETLEALWRSGRTVALEAGSAFARWLNLRYGEGGARQVASQGGLAQFRQDPLLAQAVYVFSEPVTLAEEGVPTRLYRVADSGWNPYAVLVAGRGADVRARPARAAALARALRRGWARYLRDPAEVNRLLSRLNPSMSFESMQRAAALAAPFVRGDAPALPDEALGSMSAARWGELGAQMARLGLIAEAPREVEGLFVSPPPAAP